MYRSRVLILCVSLGLAALLSAGPALARPSNRSECRRITRQIDHFKGVATMAAQRGNESWFNGTADHIRRLGERRVRLCPEYEEPNYKAIYAQWTKAVIKRAAKAFISYSTFGAF
ncbi:MAG: hypothetical protein VX466_00910 [Myxococcota bacterium]|nr:hypothetical protein [Myxococcota bacterium]